VYGHYVDFTTGESIVPPSATSTTFTQVRLKKHILVITSIGFASLADDDDYVEFIHPQDMM